MHKETKVNNRRKYSVRKLDLVARVWLTALWVWPPWEGGHQKKPYIRHTLVLGDITRNVYMKVAFMYIFYRTNLKIQYLFDKQISDKQHNW